MIPGVMAVGYEKYGSEVELEKHAAQHLYEVSHDNAVFISLKWETGVWESVCPGMTKVYVYDTMVLVWS